MEKCDDYTKVTEEVDVEKETLERKSSPRAVLE